MTIRKLFDRFDNLQPSDTAYGMKIIRKQAYVLGDLHRIVFVLGRSKRRPTLDGEDCSHQLFSVGAKKIVRPNRRGVPTKIADPEGIREHAGRVRYPVVAE